jgi:hypothetical protein
MRTTRSLPSRRRQRRPADAHVLCQPASSTLAMLAAAAAAATAAAATARGALMRACSVLHDAVQSAGALERFEESEGGMSMCQ